MLNASQKLAVEHPGGPVLVLAGAGAGKTRVLTQRVAHLIELQRVSPSRILVVTFTNKAAREMKERLIGLIGQSAVDRLWIGTFHAICGRLLRQEIYRLNYTSSFVIYDTEDQEKLMREVLSALDLETKQARTWLRQVSGLKNRGLLPHAFRREATEFHELSLAKIYDLYQERLARNNALDFDDLLLLTLRLLEEQPDLRERWQNHFLHVLVDEYQDTNRVQFNLLRLLSQKNRNIFVVGDVDQSIYSFRHADFQIILGFQADYPESAVIKLEQNYRSLKPILSAANTLIDYNRDRFDKTLRSTRGEGLPLQYYQARSEYQEADFVVHQVHQLLERGHALGDICVLYRTNAQSRLFEERLIRQRIPHQLIGAFRFYERKEIKDILAYLRVLNNPLDDLSLKRILNIPKRGIGAKTQQGLERQAEREGLSLWDTLSSPACLVNLPGKARTAIQSLMEWLKGLREKPPETVAELIQQVYTGSGYAQELQKGDPGETEERENHIESLIQAAREYQESLPEGILAGFLEQIALMSDIDGLKAEGRLLTLMTIHAAKGLEFPIVFVTGLEEGIFPHNRAIAAEENGEDGPIEEERRLMYVAMTRAQDVLWLTHAQQRTFYGAPQYQQPSRFLEELEKHLPQVAAPVSEPAPALSRLSEIVDTPLPSQSLVEGCQVYHAQWGEGRIEKITGSEKRKIVIVAFGNGIGKRILDLASAPLERIWT
ncbi:ATP-dependent DNA helicase PcrA [bacterium (Candidatus Blackallbacteria) CG17_big_fil_post_rev_8_21_14_2_50_48_46]|uniref:DNA 3'-5' helicase n=1 Tax=bacterium (Candidatus Blackallbacteria) CG17_big_fil_post_rev_8_21_14_2_50_48_46 TaxID=2014261 RepID=A0A2M7FYG7_9BACT|nr:MAG: ATP-dependent DNA helicase PcrA [bacterium (Candidatus Blackallbacteria) CG18_big_fil_WC_8_21_14_2_50_49_26]PIW14351.1 MAG: ATP-dependent DNA helicase PcrA [bacterium (Candidatus Blackallbacteria) CG17_big_fil_post_rev_8_21_14_2_50_48_46]PIW45620.1 MAG: ATP-dependent DNA helicase PcrA [bacterium (Candidatus Blackallbacteria) CG13_big_fil_rev_8_21_14_2_50_49_14]